jgi:flagellar basal body rod protein FlgC
VAGPIEAEDIVSLKTAEHAFKANAAVLAATKRMEERLLDILA